MKMVPLIPTGMENKTPEGSRNSCDSPVVILEKTAEAFAALD
jgi:hypothetical protein